jgi:hypothetical protein
MNIDPDWLDIDDDGEPDEDPVLQSPPEHGYLHSFRLHDQDGVPLSLQQDMATAGGININYAAFACDALGAGWTEERVRKTIMDARADMDWSVFRQRLAQLWAVTGGLPDPDCWSAMKGRIAP